MDPMDLGPPLGHRPFRSDQEALDLCREFSAGRLPKAAWTHRAHLTVALWYLNRLPTRDALSAIRAGIQEHNRAVGTPNTPTSGYHETITVLYVRVVASYLRDRDHSSFVEMCNRLYDELGGRELPFRYYSRDRLGSTEARLGFIEPDLDPLPDW
jgi:hypothetical protein